MAAVPLDCKPEKTMHNKCHICFTLRCANTPAGAKRGSLISSGFSSPAHLYPNGGLDDDKLKGLFIPVLRGSQRIFTGKH